MRKILDLAVAFAAGALSLTGCQEAKDAVPEVSAPVVTVQYVTSPLAVYEGTDTLDANISPEYKEHKGALKHLTVDNIRFHVIEGSYQKDRLIRKARFAYGVLGSTTSSTLCELENVRLSQLVNPRTLPIDPATLSQMADAIQANNQGIKLAYRFEADSAPFNFAARATVNLKLKL